MWQEKDTVRKILKGYCAIFMGFMDLLIYHSDINIRYIFNLMIAVLMRMGTSFY